MDDPYTSYFLLAQVTSYTFSYFLVNGLALLLLLVASALVSGSEVAFFSLGKDDLIELNQKNPEKGERHHEPVGHAKSPPKYHSDSKQPN